MHVAECLGSINERYIDRAGGRLGEFLGGGQSVCI